ncbi:hypothetical protein HPP92_016049 [Vanilla planifolia]|uniref:Rad51-like C-terminal domain-containing protein n=1 Tax=Vanilla planifolia TaxID=51239 RepID=A0A835URQ3_VANPL|nr:hypothetical protein HPP92_016049 [Vanilla planifolia]
MYIDAEGTFRPQRLIQIAERFGLNSADVLENVAYAGAYVMDHQSRLSLEAASTGFWHPNFPLDVYSATALYRTYFSGREELSARQMHMVRFLRSLQKMADEACSSQRKSRGSNLSKVISSPCLAEAKARFQISAEVFERDTTESGCFACYSFTAGEELFQGLIVTSFPQLCCCFSQEMVWHVINRL